MISECIDFLCVCVCLFLLQSVNSGRIENTILWCGIQRAWMWLVGDMINGFESFVNLKGYSKIYWSKLYYLYTYLILCIRSVRNKENKWLSHGQQDYNLWLSGQIFGCPYLEYTLTKGSFGYRFMGFMVVRRTTASVFMVVGNVFGCPGRTDNQNLERCAYVCDVIWENPHMLQKVKLQK